jgi:hypothetical protein
MTIEEENAAHLAAWNRSAFDYVSGPRTEPLVFGPPSSPLTAAEIRRELAGLPRRGLRLITKHFMWHSGRGCRGYNWDRRWYHRQIHIGMVEWESGSSGNPIWRFTLTIEFQLLPDFIRYQYIRWGRRWTVIRGIAGWPFYFSFRDWTRNPAAEGQRA